MKKFFLKGLPLFFAMFLLFSISASASEYTYKRTARYSLTKGPFIVPIENSQTNLLGPKFHDSGYAFIFLTKKNICFLFTDKNFKEPRDYLTCPRFVVNEINPNFIYADEKRSEEFGYSFHIGFDEENPDNLTSVTISNPLWGEVVFKKSEAGESVEPLKFFQMTDNQLTLLSGELALKFGSPNEAVIKRGTDTVEISYILVLNESDEKESAKITFSDKAINIVMKEYFDSKSFPSEKITP